jgi:hypothetical protein
MSTQNEVLQKEVQMSQKRLDCVKPPFAKRQGRGMYESSRKSRKKLRVERKRTATIKEKDEVVFSNSPSKSPSKCFSLGKFIIILSSENNDSGGEEDRRESNSTCEDLKSSLSPISSPKKPHSSQNSPICFLSLKSCPHIT